MEMLEIESADDTHAIPGMVIDARGQIALVLLSELAVGVSIRRFNEVLSPSALTAAIDEDQWIMARRQLGSGLYLVEPAGEEKEGAAEEAELCLTTPQAHEAAQFAIELALLLWPEWCPSCRAHFSPKADMFIPFLSPASMPAA